MADLTAKLAALSWVSRWCFLPADYVEACAAKIARGDREHGDDLSALDVAGELEGELLDAGGGYGALAVLTGQWGLRWWACCVLAGLAWRVRPRR